MSDMRILELYRNVPVDKQKSSERALQNLRNILLVFITVLYSGGAGFLNLAPILYYAFYLLLFVCVSLCLLFDKQTKIFLQPPILYSVWIALYCLWGLLVSLHQNLVAVSAATLAFRNFLFLAAIAITLVNTWYLRRVAYLIQVAVIINCIFSIRAFYDPNFVLYLAYLFPGVEFVDLLRPAGLWLNPNEASFAFALGLVMSYWTHGILKWAGRFAAILGIYLSVSRTGIFIVLLCLILYIVFKFKSLMTSPARISLMCTFLAILICVFWFIYEQPGLLLANIPENTNINRYAQYSEAFEDDRGRLAALSLDYALNGPWYGYGIFSFQDPNLVPYQHLMRVGSHNIYLAVYGEIGIFGILIYLIILITGILLTVGARMDKYDKYNMLVMWLIYIIIGFTWHNQFSSAIGIIYIGFLFHIPRMANFPTAYNFIPSAAQAKMRSVI
jgi:O-antigen ligase